MEVTTVRKSLKAKYDDLYVRPGNEEKTNLSSSKSLFKVLFSVQAADQEKKKTRNTMTIMFGTISTEAENSSTDNRTTRQKQ